MVTINTFRSSHWFWMILNLTAHYMTQQCWYFRCSEWNSEGMCSVAIKIRCKRSLCFLTIPLKWNSTGKWSVASRNEVTRGANIAATTSSTQKVAGCLGHGLCFVTLVSTDKQMHSHLHKASAYATELLTSKPTLQLEDRIHPCYY